MRMLAIMFVLVGLTVVAAGCTTGTVGSGAENAPTEAPSVIKTPEIIRILEEERIESVSTRHSQRISIRLKDGRKFKGLYVHAEAGKYSRDKDLYDILNLAMHIRENRPAREVKGWTVICE